MKSLITYNHLRNLSAIIAFSSLFLGKLNAANEPVVASLEITGEHIVVNDDDATDNLEWDYTETPTPENPTPDTGLIGPNTPEKSEPKLQRFTFTAKHTCEPGTLVVNASSNQYIKLWKDANKTEEFVTTSGGYPVSIVEDTTVEFFVEGLKHTATFDELEFTASFTVGDKTADGKIKFGVTQADIDVDSNNDAGLTATFTDDDDKLEFSRKSEQLGKIIFENRGDVDSDGIADSVDGLSLPDSPTSNACAGLKLTPMRVSLKAPFNPDTAKVKFTYNASVPRLGEGGNIVKSGAVVAGVQTYLVNKEGIRLWKVDGGARTSGNDVAAESGGDFIPANKEIAWKDIATTGAATTTIYVEYVETLEWQNSFKKEDIVLTITDNEGAKNGFIEVLGSKYELTGKESPDGVTIGILPVEFAPKILKVNADFDEGRLNATSGYAIPDCYDVGDSLRAEINHLDGIYAKDEVITDDLHNGWFGVNPKVMNDAFWDGSVVTIKKISKPDVTYGGNQEGNVRFYATWDDSSNGTGTAYQAINSYDVSSLSPTNLVGSVYGSTASIPADADFWIEGIRGGKITLEWKYKKGDVELVFEQEFLVATEQSKQDWIDEIVYEIRLQSSDDIGGQVDITTFVTSGLPTFANNKEQLFEMYDYYPELFLQTYGVNPADRDEVMAWYGLARCTTAEIVGGLAVMEDAYIKSGLGTSVSLSSPVFGPFLSYLMAHSRVTIREIQQALYLGAWDIFEDLAWQGRAYRASGIYALDASRKKGAIFRFDGWDDIDRGRRAGNIPRIRKGVVTLADREQNIVVQPAFTIIQGIAVTPTWPVSVDADHVFSLLAENPVPGGITFADFRGWNLLKNVAVAADRWAWANHTPDGIIPQWYSKTPTQHEALDLEYIEVRGRDFHARKFWPGEEPLLESEWKNDHPSRPTTTLYVP